MRVHELAKELNLSSKELLEKLQTLGVEAKSHMSRLEDAGVKLVKEGLGKPAQAVKPKPEPTPVKAPEPTSPKKAEEKPKDSPAPVASREKVAALEVKPTPATAVAEPIRVQIPITVGDLAGRLRLRASELIKTLMGLRIFANVNQLLSEEIVFKVSGHLGIPIEKISEEGEEPEKAEQEVDTVKLKPRSPVVTFMGHVDHGKTSLLDAIRKTNVAGGEAGQITQHIGAYVVELPGKGQVTFLDTPGHEAFTEMRARGANVTDVVVLVVAADDGVMPQTIEAIDHARDAEVPIIVAVNKCDLPQANPQKVMMQLQKLELVPEEWGGKTIFCKVSAKTGEGIDRLLEMLLLESEVLELKANPDQLAQGAVIESRLTKGSGPVATVIIQKGTLRVGDTVIAGPYYGRVRALRNDRGKSSREAGPSCAAEVLGLNGVPQAGEILRVVKDEKGARGIAEKRLLELREREMKGAPKHLFLENLYQRIKEGTFKDLKLILKADVQGSMEALAQSLEKAISEKVRVRVIHGAIGGVNESDVMLAAASDAIIIGFHVKAEPRVEQVAEKEGVEIRFYNIIYAAVEDVKKAMEGLLEPTLQEVAEGRAEVRQVFRSSKAGTVGGGVVLKGKLIRSSKVRLIRNQTVIFDGKFESLRRFKDDVREVGEGYEFGFVLEGWSDIQEKDHLEVYRVEKGPSPTL